MINNEQIRTIESIDRNRRIVHNCLRNNNAANATRGRIKINFILQLHICFWRKVEKREIIQGFHNAYFLYQDF